MAGMFGAAWEARGTQYWLLEMAVPEGTTGARPSLSYAE